jgi:hypothetical protein
MAKLHISQDDTGFWQLSFEDDDGTLTLISHQFPTPDHLIDDARELVEKGKVPNAAIVIGAPRPQAARARARSANSAYSKPAPRKAVD